jgi:cytochrome c-type biogenesis protein CcmE
MIMVMVVGVGITVSLVLFALNKNIDLYYTPSQLQVAKMPIGRSVRMGGLVKKNSVQRNSTNLTVHFVMTDFKSDISVTYEGVLPALFHEAQGVVVTGQFDSQGRFIATQVLAKHDEKYMPPRIKGEP